MTKVQTFLKKQSSLWARFTKGIKEVKRNKIILKSTDSDILTISGVDFNFSPPSDFTKWTVITEQTYKPQKQKFIVNLFEANFKDVPIGDQEDKKYTIITNLASRSKIIADFLVTANNAYSLQAQTPNYLLELLTPKDFSEVQKLSTEYSKEVSIFQQKKQSASEQYKNTLAKIDQEEKKVMSRYQANKNLFILNLPSTLLPITLQMAIENYTPGDNANAPNKKVYMREIMTRYKLYLLGELKKDKNIDIYKLVEENAKK